MVSGRIQRGGDGRTHVYHRQRRREADFSWIARNLFQTKHKLAWPNARYVTQTCVETVINELGEQLEWNFQLTHDNNARLQKLSVKCHLDRQRGGEFRMRHAAAAIFDLISRYRAKLGGTDSRSFPDGRKFVPIIITHFDPSRPNDLPPSTFEFEASKLESIRSVASMYATNSGRIKAAYNLPEHRRAEDKLINNVKMHIHGEGSD